MIALFIHRIGPYHRARVEAAAKVLPDLHIWEWSGRDQTYAWDPVEWDDAIPRTVLVEDQDAEELPARLLYKLLKERMAPHTPRVLVINGWGFPTSRAAIRLGLERRIPMVVMSESTPWDAPRHWPAEWLKGQLVSCFSAALVGGQAHQDYLVALGIAPEAIFRGYNAVDNVFFAQEFEKQRQALPPREKPCFLASGRFVAKKNYLRLLEAYARYVSAEGESAWDLVLLGDGSLRPEIEAAIAAHQLQKRVTLPGFVQYPDLPRYYAEVSAFIHPSTVEQWGLVVNEAMASGLPVLVSNKCGCAAELVEERGNGLRFDPESAEAMVEAMSACSQLDAETLKTWGQRSREIIKNFHPREFGNGLKAAVEHALENPRRRPVIPRIFLRISGTPIPLGGSGPTIGRL